MFFNALILLTESEAFFLSFMQNELVGKVLHYFERHWFQLFEIEVFDALVLTKVRPRKLLIAHLTHDFHSWTIILDMMHKIFTGQVLELIDVADVTTKLATFELSVILKLIQRLPNNLCIPILIIASMRKLTKVNTVSKNQVHISEEVALDVAIWTTWLKRWCLLLLIGIILLT